MALNQSYHQSQSQSQKQTLTPKLLQGVQLLQLSREELLSYLNQKALDNPLIEVHTKKKEETDYIPTPTRSQQDLGWVPDTEQSLREFVTEQVLLSYRDTYLREMIFWWINQLDENGYVSVTLEEAAKETGADRIQMLDALTLLQQLEPAGVGARHLQECLMLQTERLDDAPAIAYLVLEDSFNDFAERKWERIAKRYSVSLADIQEVSDFVQRLSASPGAPFKHYIPSLVIPELILTRENGELQVKESTHGTILLHYKEKYVKQLESYEDTEVNRYLEKKKQEYDVLQKNLELRGETILRVGAAIVEKQKDFFLNTRASLAPLQRKELAEELGLHESTISRAVQDTYIQTDNGVYELTTFFSRKQAATGESTDSVQQALQQLVEEEDKKKPLSDQKLVDHLTTKGFDISRRTVAKYRTQLHIPSSSKRKRYE